MYPILLVAVGGALGALTRYGVNEWVLGMAGKPTVFATWTANLVGCLLIGLLVPVLGRVGLGSQLQLLLVVGFLGSLTTFSTFSLETVSLLEDGLGGMALLNAVGSVVVGAVFVWAGLQLSRTFLVPS